MNKSTATIAFRMGVVYSVVLVILVSGFTLFWTRFFVPSLRDAEQAKADIFTESYGSLIERSLASGGAADIDLILVQMIELKEDKLTDQPFFSKVEVRFEDGRVLEHVNPHLSLETSFRSHRLLFLADFEPGGVLMTWYNPAYFQTAMAGSRRKFMGGVVLMVLALVVSFVFNLVLVRPLKLLANRLNRYDFNDPRPIEIHQSGNAYEIEAVQSALNLVLCRLRESLAEVQEQYRFNRESEARFDRAVQGTSDGLWEWDLEKGALWFAPRFYQLLGYESGAWEPTLEQWQALMHPDDQCKAERAASRHLKAAAPYDVQYRMKHKSGEWRWFQGRAAAVRNSSGQAVKLSGSVQDITQKREFETVRERLMEKLSEKNDELEQVIYAASHDLRSPLVNIQGFSHELDLSIQEMENLIEASGLPDEARAQVDALVQGDMMESLGYIKRSAVKMDGLLSGLLALSRLGRYPLQMKMLDMNGLVASVFSDFEFVIKESAVKVTLTDLSPIMGDEVQINQAFSNLVGNALKYLDPKRPGELTVACESRGDEVVYHIADNGLGIPISQQSHVFDLFKRVHTQHAEGEGLGLAIVKKIMSRHGGRVWFSSTEGVGSKFFLSLPVEKDILEEPFTG